MAAMSAELWGLAQRSCLPHDTEVVRGMPRLSSGGTAGGMGATRGEGR